MNLNILTDTVQSWQIDGWIEQGYTVICRVEDYNGFVENVYPGHIIINTGDGIIDVSSIPTKVAKLDGAYIILGGESMSGSYSDAPPMPKVKSCKDSKVEEDAVLRIMQLCIYGAIVYAGENQEDQFEATKRVVKLFKEANLIK